ncbi:DUF1304 domain-containing protein [Arthrobacter sp. zg-ZUI100]|uniref:DUF1304 domain-containing protein n=1 Tax=Arthrobacter jiangjiafuii TaxID=2817475 RepID=A0A975M8K8_9MICC|nr:DUF1304 domain-containing protein [Arthrobacter jiangjiafuii]MBP3035596.1 DUF1304 domain-containing protein [Arthrobacter jiangjiafuii]MBP3042209.1 DUF1304 domain-containing protein [Arthrobacter jiangjiafuii]QWC11892.1 DUF1304 domain-containing protein [Arthrobacter jiangjiafuii]
MVLITAAVFAVIAAAIHLYIFVLESLRWTAPTTMAVFRVATPQEAAATQALAYNQGFYNLFLGVGALLGVVLLTAGSRVAGLTLISFASASMVLAALVLVISNRAMIRPALIQGGPALICLVFTVLGA